MEKPHSQKLDWQTSPPLSLEDKAEKLARVRTGLSQIPKIALTPRQRRSKKSAVDNLTEEATFAFNTLTDYDTNLDRRIIDSTDITNHLDAANTFRLLAKHSGKDARVFGETIPDYANILEDIASNTAHENFNSFEGTNDILTDWYHPPDYENSGAASALLFKEQWDNLIQKQWQRNAHGALLGQETYGSNLYLMPEELTVDVKQITLLCNAQTDLQATLTQDNNSLDKEAQRENLDNVVMILESPELREEKIADLPAATVIKKLTLAQAVRALGELSEDANPKDFARNRENSIMFAINQLREAEMAIDRVIEDAPLEVLNLNSIKDKIRFLHDSYANEANMPQIGWTEKSLADLPEFEVPVIDYIKHVPELPKSRIRKKIGVLAALTTPRRQEAKR